MPNQDSETYLGQQEIADSLEDISPSNFSRKTIWFNSIAQMKAAPYLKVGNTAATRGKLTLNDAKGFFFYIREKTASDTESEDLIFLDNEYVAEALQFSAITPSNLDISRTIINTEYFHNFGQGAGFHNSIYRGLNLGSSVTAEQYAAISSGTFDNLFIGDYWTINSINWRIAAFDYWYNHGDTACTTHHVVIVPDSNLATCQMNNSNVTTGAYVGSNYYTGANSNTGKATAQAAINNAFGASHILTHREYLKNAVTNVYESGGAWYDSTFELMTEQMVYGGKVFGNVINGTNWPYSYTIDEAQLPLFRFRHDLKCNRATYWLRDVSSSTDFSYVYGNGAASNSNASGSSGVRPAFALI